MKIQPFKISVIFLSLICFFNNCIGQIDSTNAPYLKYQKIPPFIITNALDSSLFSNKNLKKNVSTIFIVFNPDCEFCQHETIDLLKNITRFKNTQIVMVSYMSYDMLKQFYKRYQIANYPIITMGRDENFFLLKFFKIRILPSTFVYDKNGNFKKAFKQRVDMDPLLEEL
jgi:peroxiredoxin